MQTTTYTKHAYFHYIADYTAYEQLSEAQRTQFTQKEKAFVLTFLADTLASLTSINAECATDASESYFMRLADAQEVMQNLQTLYDTLTDDDDCTNIQFTLKDAGAALCSYDTEYRECICEQFEDATDERAKLQQAQHESDCDFATLACRIFNNY